MYDPQQIPQPFTQPEDIRTERQPRSAWPVVTLFSIVFAVIMATLATWLGISWSDERARLIATEAGLVEASNQRESAEQEVSRLQEELEAARSLANLDTGSDEAQVVAVAERYAVTFMTDVEGSEVSVEQLKDGQAIVGIVKNNIRHTVYLEKQNTIWHPIWAGKGNPSSEQRAFYGMTLE